LPQQPGKRGDPETGSAFPKEVPSCLQPVFARHG
jgi:hypothetical protein